MFLKQADFALKDPKSVKIDSQVISHFGLLGSSHAKAASNRVDEIEVPRSPSESDETPWVNFINVLRTAFTPVGPQSAKRHC